MGLFDFFRRRKPSIDPALRRAAEDYRRDLVEGADFQKPPPPTATMLRRVAVRSAVGLVMLAATNGIALAQGARGDALAVLATRPGWERLPSGLVKTLAERLGSATKATEFAQICEKSGILNNMAHPGLEWVPEGG